MNAEDAAIGAWIRLVAYCASQKNGGVIQAPVNTTRGWLALCGTALAAVRAAVDAGLVSMSDDMQTFTVQGLDEMTRASNAAHVERQRSEWRAQWHARVLLEDSERLQEALLEGEYGSEISLSEKKSTNIQTRSKSPLGVPPPADFDAFWKAYPRKAAKVAALKAWLKRKPPLAECLKALAWQSKSKDWTKDKGKFIPHPATWINSGRWEDEPTAGSIPFVSESFREIYTGRPAFDKSTMTDLALDLDPVENGLDLD